MQTFELNNGTHIPAVGLGLYLVSDRKECVDAVRSALEAGYTHFDTAQYYGNEAYLAEAIKYRARSELFITTKIANDNMVPGRVRESFNESLERLQSDYVDLLLLHFPVSGARQAAWDDMEAIARAGQAKAIGVSNYTIRHLEELLGTCSIQPAVNQVELHVYLQQPELVKYCQDHGILVEAYSPLAHGRFVDTAVLETIGKKYNKTATQVMLRWCLEIGTVPLPKSVHADRIKANIDIFDFSLDGEDMAAIRKLNRNLRVAWDPSDVA